MGQRYHCRKRPCAGLGPCEILQKNSAKRRHARWPHQFVSKARKAFSTPLYPGSCAPYPRLPPPRDGWKAPATCGPLAARNFDVSPMPPSIPVTNAAEATSAIGQRRGRMYVGCRLSCLHDGAKMLPEKGDAITGSMEAASSTDCSSTVPMRRYPRRGRVSTYRGVIAESPSASRSLLIAAFRPWVQSTREAPGQRRRCSSSRVTSSPGCASNISRI